jgi:hypothetical protein
MSFLFVKIQHFKGEIPIYILTNGKSALLPAGLFFGQFLALIC